MTGLNAGVRGAVHPTAYLHPEARVDPSAAVGPLARVEAGACLAAGVRIGSRAWVGAGVEVGEGSFIDTAAVVGSPDRGAGRVVLGRGVRVREYAVVEPGRDGPTRVGDGAFIMGRTRVGAGSRIGERVVLTHASVVGPGAELQEGAVVGGFGLVEAGVVVGRRAMVAAMSRVDRPVPPYVLVHGNPARPVGLNIVGLRRSGARPDARQALQRAFRLLFRSGVPLEQAEAELEDERRRFEELDEMLAFLRRHRRAWPWPAEKGAERR